MTTSIPQADMEALEAMIDSYDLSMVLAAMVEICHGKAEHLRNNWQDDESAKHWESSATRIDAVADTL